jgi:hypothetical protein
VHLRQALAINPEEPRGFPAAAKQLIADKKMPPATEAFLPCASGLLLAIYHASRVVQQTLGGRLQEGFKLIF